MDQGADPWTTFPAPTATQRQSSRTHCFIFTMDYEIDPLRQSIGDSCPSSLDDSTARREWGWEPAYDLEATVEDMLKNLS